MSMLCTCVHVYPVMFLAMKNDALKIKANVTRQHFRSWCASTTLQYCSSVGSGCSLHKGVTSVCLETSLMSRNNYQLKVIKLKRPGIIIKKQNVAQGITIYITVTPVVIWSSSSLMLKTSQSQKAI